MDKRTNTLYLIRFLAALVIIIYHYTPAPLKPSLDPIIKNGNEAVNLFFFISGFVLIISNASYLGSAESRFPVRFFYVKRVARIYPLYILAILVLAAFHYWIKSIDTSTVKYRLPFELPGIQRWLYAGSFNYPGWSISCEFFFYLLFPFIIQGLKRNARVFTMFVLTYWLIAMWATYSLSAVGKGSLPLLHPRLVSTLFMHPVLLISIFMCGMLTGKWYTENKFAFIKKTPLNIVLLIVTCALIVALKNYLPTGSGLLKGGLFAPLYFMLIYAIINLSGRWALLLSNPLFIFLGEISYAMYIFQYPIYVFYTHFLQEVTGYLSLLSFTATVIITAGVLHLLIEKPFRKAIISYYAAKTNQT
ncbi:acyltransferase [Mucilaginibacter sp.]|uniref:acyltransferase family protein n=1 Tax=Mucilaginibacter sp. TaxID=1882438 RepID=UPI003265D495